MICPKCGRSLYYGVAFCVKCDTKLCQGCYKKAKMYDVPLRCGECLDHPNREIRKAPSPYSVRITPEKPEVDLEKEFGPSREDRDSWPWGDDFQGFGDSDKTPTTKKIIDPFDTKP